MPFNRELEIFDLGAHQCVVACMLARIIGPGGLVVAVEANRHNAEAGRRNIELTLIDNIRVLHAAAADRPGSLFINQSLNGIVDSDAVDVGRSEVKAVSIDELTDMFGQPNVLFIDVEGYECKVLKGAEHTLKSRPDCFVEVHVGIGLENFGGSVAEVLSHFPQDAYQIHVAPPDGQEFVTLSDDCEFLTQRFFLLALATKLSTKDAASRL